MGEHRIFKPGDYCRALAAIDDALAMMVASGVPHYYAEGLRPGIYESLRTCIPNRAYKPTSCYLAFYGNGDTASHLKVGVAKDCKKRFMGAATDNPLKRMWCYAVRFDTREEAGSAERLALHNMKEARCKGEWVVVHSISEGVSAAMVASLGEYIASMMEIPVVFERIDV